MNDLPIPMEIIQKRIEIPAKIAELSYKDADLALHYLRVWGEKRMPITPLHAELSECLKKISRG